MTENERVYRIRKSLGLTMEEFGKRLGVTKTAISNIESGNRGLTSQMATAICREFDVNESWLRTGEGEMRKPKNRSMEIGQIVRASASGDPEEAVEFFTGLLADMSDSEILLMYEIFKRHFPTAKAPAVAEAEALYESSLGFAPSTTSTASNTTAATAAEKASNQ